MAVTRRRGRSAGENTADEIRQVALDLFFKRGFQATTLRHIASRVGIQVGSLYNHITSKGDLLFDIMETVMLDLLEDQRQVAQTRDVVERMRLLVYHHVKFHGERADEDFIRQGKFLPVDVQITAYGILAMATWVSAWYSSRGRLSLEEIAEIYTAMVLRGIWNPAAGQLETHLRRVGRDTAKRSLAASAAAK